MEVLTVEIKDSKTIRLIEDLEASNLLKIIQRNIKRKAKTRISERLSGSISSEEADIMYRELEQMRGEWDRNI